MCHGSLLWPCYFDGMIPSGKNALNKNFFVLYILIYYLCIPCKRCSKAF